MTEVPLKEEVLLLAHSWRGRSQLIVAGKSWQQGMVWLWLDVQNKGAERDDFCCSFPLLAYGLVPLPCRAGLPSSVSLRWKWLHRCSHKCLPSGFNLVKWTNNTAFYRMSLERLSAKNKLDSFLLSQVVYRISRHYAEVIARKKGFYGYLYFFFCCWSTAKLGILCTHGSLF